MRKPILSRVPTYFTFAMHNMANPTFFACAPDKFGSHHDCHDSDLWLVHLKCVDLAPSLASAVYLTRNDLGGKANESEQALRHRCGNVERWRASGCELGPHRGAEDSPNGTHCRKPVRLSFGIAWPPQKVLVERLPAWLQDRV